MTDRVIEHPGRYQLMLVDGESNIYDLTAVPGTVTAEGTDLNKANILPDATVALLGLLGDPTISDAFVAVATAALPQKNLVNILQLKLQQSLAASDIDAWSDLLADDSLISALSDSVVLGGQLFAGLSQLSSTYNANFGSSTTISEKKGQSFLSTLGGSVSSVLVKLSKVGSPTDNVVMKIYETSAGAPTGSALYTSTNTIAGATITTSEVDYTFNFSGASLSGSTTYAFALERTGALNASNYYRTRHSASASPYANGSMVTYENSAWSVNNYDLYFSIRGLPGIAEWSAVTPTEALSFVAICAEQTENAGTITWFLSDDGASWTEITSLDAMQDVGFDQAEIYLKCVLTGDATVEAVAYGGY